MGVCLPYITPCMLLELTHLDTCAQHGDQPNLGRLPAQSTQLVHDVVNSLQLHLTGAGVQEANLALQ